MFLRPYTLQRAVVNSERPQKAEPEKGTACMTADAHAADANVNAEKDEDTHASGGVEEVPRTGTAEEEAEEKGRGTTRTQGRWWGRWGLLALRTADEKGRASVSKSCGDDANVGTIVGKAELLKE
ncbi:hypothetical protein EIP86_004085 [Pleurotus ostreatoroseus]|nr:hypothetical protein EIP86_004085 [Pleurotus ostreatoroseus]